jgi:hypothetical protein
MPSVSLKARSLIPDIYFLYGMRIEVRGASAPLAAVSTTESPDVTFSFGGFPPDIPLLPRDRMARSPEQDGADNSRMRVFRLQQAPFLHLCFPEDIEFLVHADGGIIYGNWPGQFQLPYVAPLILGPLMGFLLRLMRVTTLHASVVEINGRAVVMTGAGGAGKSTTAAAFAIAGFSVLSDDLAPIRHVDGAFQIAPGYPRICLWPESVRLLFGSEEALPLITEGWGKRYLDLSSSPYRFCSEPLPIGAIYWISDRDESPEVPRIDPMPPQDSVKTLVGNTYAGIFGDRSHSAQDLRTYAGLISSVPVRRVSPGRGPVSLQLLCKLIQEDSAHV